MSYMNTLPQKAIRRQQRSERKSRQVLHTAPFLWAAVMPGLLSLILWVTGKPQIPFSGVQNGI